MTLPSNTKIIQLIKYLIKCDCFLKVKLGFPPFLRHASMLSRHRRQKSLSLIAQRTWLTGIRTKVICWWWFFNEKWIEWRKLTMWFISRTRNVCVCGWVCWCLSEAFSKIPSSIRHTLAFHNRQIFYGCVEVALAVTRPVSISGSVSD